MMKATPTKHPLDHTSNHGHHPHPHNGNTALMVGGNFSPASLTTVSSKLASSCLACAEDISGRCSYCLREKSSMIPRMKIFDLGKRILDEHPNIQAEKLLHMLHDYGRSSKVALDLNNRLSYGHGEQAMCDMHVDAMSDLSTKASKLSLDVESLTSNLQMETDIKNTLLKQLEEATCALEELSHSSQSNIIKLNELEMMSQEDNIAKSVVIEEYKKRNQESCERIKVLERRLGMSLPNQSDPSDTGGCEGCREANAQLRALKTRWAEFLDVSLCAFQYYTLLMLL
jgi:hypothetical protein